MVSFKQLHYALAVDRQRHFRKAADECAISQSALSTAIAELESQLGAQIFERDNKRVLVTPLGRELLERARQVTLLVADMRALAASRQQPLSGPMSLGVIPTIGPYLLPKVLPSVREEYPLLQLRIEEHQSDVLVDKVRSGELDTAVLALPFNLAGLHSFEFWEENFLVATWPGSELARSECISSSELQDAPLLMLRDGHCLKDHALAACKFKPGKVNQTVSGTSLYTLLQMVAGGMGSTFVPEMAVDQLAGGSREVKLVELSEPGPHRRPALIARLNFGRTDDLLLLGELFRRRLAES